MTMNQTLNLTGNYVIQEIAVTTPSILLLISVTGALLFAYYKTENQFIPFYFFLLSILIFVTEDLHNLYAFLSLITFGMMIKF